ncbi:MAG: hypothetical protein DMG66_00180 [Acidobacteria bacterium]|nr:MAG: hypothetical protein DMG66_00180 [Acidobacteriota bacterium]
MPKSDRITRRQFARGAAVAAAGVALLPHRLAAQSYPPPGSKLSPEAQSEVEAKLQNVLRKYGSRLSQAEKADVRRLLLLNQESLEQLRSYQLENSDQPALVLRAGEK